MKTYKVLHVGGLNCLGGAEFLLFSILSKPIPNFEMHVFSRHPFSSFWLDKMVELGVYYKNSNDTAPWVTQLVQYALQKNIDLVHLHYPWRKAKIALKKAGIKIVIEHDHGFSWQRHPCQILKDKFRGIWRYTDGIIAVSDASRIMLSERLGYPSEKITVINNGIDFKRLANVRPFAHPSDKTIITTISRLVPLKKVDTLIKSIPKILSEQSNFEFWIIGDGPLKTELEQLAINLGVNEYVKFWGEQRYVGDFLASTDIFVLPTIQEALGLVLLEAGYFGIPVIATNVDGITDIITNGETGVLLEATIPVNRNEYKNYKESIPPKVVDGKTRKIRNPMSIDPELLGRTILDISNNPQYSMELGNNLRKTVISKFNINTFHNMINDYYRNVIINATSDIEY
jgi:glycosyltransferase involved in cell wall biosynthesis